VKKRVLLTGATGTMGLAGLQALLGQSDLYEIHVFSMDSKEDRRILKPFEKEIEIHWGDLRCYEDVRNAVRNMDMVLHVGALVSPKADRYPDLAWDINYGGTKNIVDAIVECGNKETCRLLYVGTVAQTGNRKPPVHWGRVGDPLIPSVYDYYALSKIAAERYVIESALKYWVSVRQTGILHKELVGVNDGIAYHVPFDMHMEWVTAEDSGRLLANVCRMDDCSAFWRKVYNIGGGPSCRLTGHEFMTKVFGLINVDYKTIYEPNMFALMNFHGQYYLDSDDLNQYLDFRRQSADDLMNEIKDNIPLSVKILKYLPKGLVKLYLKEESKRNQITPLYWIKHKEEEKIKAYFGSLEGWREIGNWETIKLTFQDNYKVLDHGYNEKKDTSDWCIEDMRQAAEFRGGTCLSEDMTPHDVYQKLTWQCAEGHTFDASPYTVLKTGHWCPVCVHSPWDFGDQALKSEFIAQVWNENHKINTE